MLDGPVVGVVADARRLWVRTRFGLHHLGAGGASAQLVVLRPLWMAPMVIQPLWMIAVRVLGLADVHPLPHGYPGSLFERMDQNERFLGVAGFSR